MYSNTGSLFKLMKIKTKIFLRKCYSYLLEGKGGQHVEMATLSPSFVDCKAILGPSTSWSRKGICRAAQGWYFFL